MNASDARKGLIGVAVLLVALYVALGVSNTFFNPESSAVRQLGSFWAGMIGCIPAAMIVVGLWAQRRSPSFGSILLLAGAVPLGVLMYWTIFLPILALLVVLFWSVIFFKRGEARYNTS